MHPTDTTHPDYFHKVVDCQWACPAHTDVPEYIRLIAQGRFTEAYMVNRQSNVFPGILGRVCDRPCEPACRRGRVEDEPVAIIPFDPQIFGTAANNGQMIAEVAAGHRTAETFRQMAQLLTGRSETKKARTGLFAPLLGKLGRR